MLKNWSSEEIEFLTLNYSKLGLETCASQLNRSKDSVAAKASRLHLKQKINKWTIEEENIIRKYFPTKGGSFCQKLLPARTITAIRNRAAILNIIRTNRAKTNNEYDLELFNIESDLYRVEDYIDWKTPILHQCVKGHLWKFAPDNARRGKTCQVCNPVKYGRDLRKSGRFYYIKIESVTETYYKVGITSRDIKTRFSKDWNTKKITVLIDEEHKELKTAFLKEQEILNKYSDKRITVDNFLKSKGNTELFVEDVLKINLDI